MVLISFTLNVHLHSGTVLRPELPYPGTVLGPELPREVLGVLADSRGAQGSLFTVHLHSGTVLRPELP